MNPAPIVAAAVVGAGGMLGVDTLRAQSHGQDDGSALAACVANRAYPRGELVQCVDDYRALIAGLPVGRPLTGFQRYLAACVQHGVYGRCLASMRGKG